jgi:hypothetical protein
VECGYYTILERMKLLDRDDLFEIIKKVKEDDEDSP